MNALRRRDMLAAAFLANHKLRPPERARYRSKSDPGRHLTEVDKERGLIRN